MAWSRRAPKITSIYTKCARAQLSAQIPTVLVKCQDGNHGPDNLQPFCRAAAAAAATARGKAMALFIWTRKCMHCARVPIAHRAPPYLHSGRRGSITIYIFSHTFLGPHVCAHIHCVARSAAYDASIIARSASTAYARGHPISPSPTGAHINPANLWTRRAVARKSAIF